MDKFVYLKFAEKRQDIPIDSKIIKLLPWYFKYKYIIEKTPLIIKEIEYLDIEGYEVIIPLLESELNSPKSDIIIENTLFKLENMEVLTATTDINYFRPESNIQFMYGKNLMSFFILEAIKRILKFTRRTIQHTEVIIIDNDDESSTYNIIDSIYEELNYFTIFTNRREYFEEYSEKIYSDTGLNLQITEQNKSALKSADIIINLSADSTFNFDYFYKKGAVYFELSGNSQKTLEILRKRQDITIIDDIIINCDNKTIKNNILEAVLYIKNSAFRSFVDYNKCTENKNYSTMKYNNINIVGFYQYGNIIRQYCS